MVTSHQHTPNNLPRAAQNFTSMYMCSQWTNVGFGGETEALTGKPHLTMVSRLPKRGAFCFGRAAPILLPSSVCSAAFLWEICKAKPGLFGGLALPLSPGTWHIPKSCSRKLWGPDFLPIPCSHLSQRGDIYFSLQAPKSRLEAATQPHTSPLSPQTQESVSVARRK